MTADPDPFEQGRRAARENIPAEGPLAAPPVLPPLALPPPALCAWAIMGRVKIAIAVIAAVTDVLVIGHLRWGT